MEGFEPPASGFASLRALPLRHILKHSQNLQTKNPLLHKRSSGRIQKGKLKRVRNHDASTRFLSFSPTLHVQARLRLGALFVKAPGIGEGENSYRHRNPVAARRVLRPGNGAQF
jgi:hypothetical protein